MGEQLFDHVMQYHVRSDAQVETRGRDAKPMELFRMVSNYHNPTLPGAAFTSNEHGGT
jgi:hypothetical protein